ncbi:MAG: sulfurtransferase TusA family protein [Dehalococcoidia bacterium]|jgi:tRNA 2-thiouridine synthesizing protein A|nr:MAG: TusA-related sulfurtransferase [Chloroflexota bacterium]|tara:strand:+ start:1133 stop:1363 length:231 start_codon:yes stop_codon:yes gene_type:complete
MDNKKLLDVRGEICPYPMIKTNQFLDQNIENIQQVEVITDHPPALSTIPPEAIKRGFACEINETKNGEWAILLTKI